jgi:IS1 family transposase
MPTNQALNAKCWNGTQWLAGLPVSKNTVRGRQKNTQKIERKNLNLRTLVKRLTRKTICFSKSEVMHDTVIGLLINKVE